MQIEIVFWLLIVATTSTAAICLMVGHAIGYRKAEVIGKKHVSIVTRKAYTLGYKHGLTGREPWVPRISQYKSRDRY